jgi:hypothetical protein
MVFTALRGVLDIVGVDAERGFRGLSAGNAVGGVTEGISRSEAKLNFGVCGYALKEGRGIDGIRIEAAKVFVEDVNLRLHLRIGNVFRRRAIDNMHDDGNGDDIIGTPVRQVALGFYVRLGLCLHLGHARQDRGGPAESGTRDAPSCRSDASVPILKSKEGLTKLFSCGKYTTFSLAKTLTRLHADKLLKWPRGCLSHLPPCKQTSSLYMPLRSTEPRANLSYP